MRHWLARFHTAFLSVFTDPAARSVMVLGIAIYGVFYPQPYLHETVRDVPLVVVDQDMTATSRTLIRRIDATDSVAIVATQPDMAEARRTLLARQAQMILMIPPGFERDLNAGRAAPLAAYGDAGYFVLYNAAMTAVSGVTRGMGAEIGIARMTAAGEGRDRAAAATHPLTITPVALFNPQGGYASYIVPAAAMLILQQTLLMGAGLLNGGSRSGWRRGPSPMAEGTARIAAYVLVYLVWMLAYVVLLPQALGVPRIGRLPDMLLLGLPFLLSTALLGMALARLIPQREWIVVAMMGLGLPVFFLSGIAWPVEMLPGWLYGLARLLPSTEAISGLVQVNQMGADWRDVAPKVLWLWGLVLAYGAAALLPAPRRAKTDRSGLDRAAP